MGNNTKDSTRMTNGTGMESLHGPMAINMKDSLLTILELEMELTFGQTEISILVSPDVAILFV